MTRQTEPGDGYEDDGLFRTVMFGYDRAQVDDYVNAICDELQVLSVAVKRLAPVEEELAAAHVELRRLQGQVSATTPSATASARITHMLRIAEEEAAALRGEADETLTKARQDADVIRRDAELDTEHVAAARRRENQRAREDIIAGARAEAARILSDANVRGGNLAVSAIIATNGHNGSVNGSVNGSAGGSPPKSPSKAGSPNAGPMSAGPVSAVPADGSANGPVHGVAKMPAKKNAAKRRTESP
ncbi:hypothetical protein AB0M47_23725 [Hamadaea sp. NPDC051192]|uniref:DivIVA domain-containing protein n=1 Tax=Hamadaea sp. NPDC051192 TaxID=3154940 RepID=UPI003430E7EF